MEPVVYDFAINERGTWADLLTGADGSDAVRLLHHDRSAVAAPELGSELSPLRRAELDTFATACRTKPELRGMVQTLFDVMLPRGKTDGGANLPLNELLERHGFDRVMHEQIRADLQGGRIGLAQNRLPANAVIEDVRAGDVMDFVSSGSDALKIS